MIMKGYTLVIKDYVAEICEVRAIELINAPDGTQIYHIQTKYGEDFVKSGDVVPVRKMLEEQCEELNKELKKSGEKRVAKRRNQNYRW